MAKAEAARNDAGLKPDGTPNRKSPVYIGGYDEAGSVMGTGNGPRGSNIHAEDLIQEWSPGAQMTEPFAWRRNLETGELEWISHTVCGLSEQVSAVSVPAWDAWRTRRCMG